MVKKGIQILSILFFIITFCFVCPFNIAGESGTYTQITTEYTTVMSNLDYKQSNQWGYIMDFKVTSGNDVRYVLFYTGSYYYNYLVSDQPFTVERRITNINLQNTETYQYNTFTGSSSWGYYIVARIGGWGNSFDEDSRSYKTPIVNETSVNNQTAIYYTFGDGAIAPEPEVDYGDLITGFYTSFAGSGTLQNDKTWRENIDTITWEYYDTNGNDLGKLGYIEIRAVPGEFIDLDRMNLASKLYSDFVLSGDSFSMGLYAPSTGHTSYRWGDIATYFGGSSPDTWDMYAYFRAGYWVKNGWIYQIRLVDKDDETVGLTDWQTIYTISSVSGDDSMNEPDSLNPNLVRTIETVNNQNNTTNNYYYGDTTINMSEDPDDGTGKPWWSYLLEAITSVLNRIIDGISQILSALLGRDINLGDRDIDVNLEVNNYLDDLDNKAQDININLPQWQLSNDVVSGLNVMKGLAGRVIDIYNDNGILIFILLPILIGILGILL